jgi:hypothetical protein
MLWLKFMGIKPTAMSGIIKYLSHWCVRYNTGESWSTMMITII